MSSDRLARSRKFADENRSADDTQAYILNAMCALSRGATKSRNARTLIGKKRLAA